MNEYIDISTFLLTKNLQL